MNRGAWQATEHGMAKSWTQLSNSACLKSRMEAQYLFGGTSYTDTSPVVPRLNQEHALSPPCVVLEMDKLFAYSQE